MVLINTILYLNMNTINIITRLLNKTYCFGCKINNKIVEKQIQKEIQINDMLFSDPKLIYDV